MGFVAFIIVPGIFFFLINVALQNISACIKNYYAHSLAQYYPHFYTHCNSTYYTRLILYFGEIGLFTRYENY